MEIRRGEQPKAVERELSVDITADEVLIILTNYIKRKMNTDRVRVDEIGATLSKDTGKLLSMTLTGAEVIPLTWTAPPSSESATQPPAPTETQ